jgi:hypothetical protein
MALKMVAMVAVVKATRAVEVEVEVVTHQRQPSHQLHTDTGSQVLDTRWWMASSSATTAF